MTFGEEFDLIVIAVMLVVLAAAEYLPKMYRSWRSRREWRLHHRVYLPRR